MQGHAGGEIYHPNRGYGFFLLLPLNLLVLAGPRFVLVLSWLGMVVVAVYVAIAARSFIRPGWTTTAMSFVAFSAGYLLFSFVAGIVGFCGGALRRCVSRWPRHRAAARHLDSWIGGVPPRRRPPPPES